VPSRPTPTPSAGSPTDGGIRYLTAYDLVDLHRAVSTEFGGSQAQPGVVDSQFALDNVVKRPQVTMLGREAYPSFSDKAAVLIFALLQSRPFHGHNRRVALASLIAFCELNRRTIDAKVLDEKALENLLKRGSAQGEDGLPPENAFREFRETLGRAIIATT
jgi:prophage maintenance system killer protein